MSNIYVSHNTIISSLGFSSKAVVENIKNEVSGVHEISNKDLFSEPFYASVIDKNQLLKEVKQLSNYSAYTTLEQLMILALKNVISASNIKVNDKLGVVISTTKGNVDVLDENSPFPASRAYLDQLSTQIQDYFSLKHTPIVLSNACVSGVLALAVAKRYIQSGIYDNVLVVGGDLVTQFILSGFNSFQAMSKARCKPYDVNRVGINIGEITACALVTNSKDHLAEEAVEMLGEGSCNDANHISGPSRTGEGLYRSIQSAFEEANVSSKDVDYISAHGTATIFNDEMEAIAFNRHQLQSTPLNSLKGYFGHSLGASGLVETIIGMHSLHNNILFRSLGFEKQGTTVPINVIERTEPKALTTFLKTASGFGGCNTAAVFKKYMN